MPRYRCASCGKLFDPSKNELCPKCGAAVAPSVLTRIERKTTAERLRAEGMRDYDDHCHEDDGWKSNSYGAESRRAALQAHEAEMRASYAAHRPADEPTRPERPGPVASEAPNPTQVSNANPSNPTRVSNAKPLRASNAGSAGSNQKKGKSSGLGWFVIIWFLIAFLRAFFED